MAFWAAVRSKMAACRGWSRGLTCFPEEEKFKREDVSFKMSTSKLHLKWYSLRNTGRGAELGKTLLRAVLFARLLVQLLAYLLVCLNFFSLHQRQRRYHVLATATSSTKSMLPLKKSSILTQGVFLTGPPLNLLSV